MARKNRLVAEDAIYHVSSRIAHREFFLEDEGIKSEIVSWMYGIAEFCPSCSTDVTLPGSCSHGVSPSL